MNHASRSEGHSEGVAFGGCNMRVLRQTNHIESRARPRECHLKLGGCHGDKKESHTQNQNEAQENPRHKDGHARKDQDSQK
jgi:hypothetical protein